MGLNKANKESLSPKHAPRYYRKKEKGWLESAQRDLSGLGPG